MQAQTDTTIDITGKDKAEVLAALYNAAKTQGMGFLHFDPTPMTVDEARAILAEASPSNAAGDYPFRDTFQNLNLYFDYFKGRVMKVDLGKDDLRVDLYDRDNGDGAARRALVNAGVISE